MEKWKNTVLSTVEHLLGRHPEIVLNIVNMYRTYLSNQVADFHKNTIAHGPLKGLKLHSESHWGNSDRGVMILGLYEQEILESLSHIGPQYTNFIDLGAADGYYGIGELVC